MERFVDESENLASADLAEGSPTSFIKGKLTEFYEADNVSGEEKAKGLTERDGQFKPFFYNPQLFFAELIKIVEANRDQDKAKVAQFLGVIHDTFFSFSPSIINNFSMNEMLSVMASVNRVEEMRGFVGQTFVGEFAYNLAFSGDGITTGIADYIDSLPAGSREEAICQMETVYANALANGDWAEPALLKVRSIVDHFAASDYPLSRLVAKVANERIQAEDDNPSLGVLTYADNKGAGRLHSYKALESVADRFISNLPFGYQALVVAKDVIIGTDHAGMPRFGATKENSQRFLEQPDLGLRLLNKLNGLDKLDFMQLDVRELVNSLGQFRAVFAPDTSVVSFYADIFGLTEDEMSEIIDRGDSVNPFLHRDWLNIRERISALVGKELAAFATRDIEQVKFESFSDLTNKAELNIFSNITDNDKLLLAQCLRPEVRAHLEADLGLALNAVSFRSQISFLRFLATESQVTYDRLLEVLNKNPTNKIKIFETFIGCSEDIQFGDQFLTVCEKATEFELTTFLDFYAGVVLQSADLQAVIEASQNRLNSIAELQASYTRIALKKGHKMLDQWQADSAKAHDQGLEYRPNPEMLKDYQAQAVAAGVFASVFQQLLKEYGPSSLEMAGSFDAKSVSELSDAEKTDVENMYRENYKHKDQKFCQVLVEIFRERCAKGRAMAYLLKNKDQVVSFLTIEPRDENDGSVYFSSFNTDSHYQGVSIGEAMMKKVLDEHAKEHVIYADCDPTSPISHKYLANGFKIVERYDFAGVPSIKIRRDDRLVQAE